jgi:hypothetical protein
VGTDTDANNPAEKKDNEKAKESWSSGDEEFWSGGVISRFLLHHSQFVFIPGYFY